MTYDQQVIEWFKNHHDEYFSRFDLIKYKRSLRRDLHAMLLLDDIENDKECSLICEALNNEICFSIDYYKLTEGQVKELLCCGVNYDNRARALIMCV